jgi:DNA-binding IclR family transcriptional regulator
MTLNHNELRTLDLLFQLASSDVPATARRVAERAGRPEAEVLSDLSALARHGLIHPARCRLTFAGLAIAASRAGERTGLASLLRRAA